MKRFLPFVSCLVLGGAALLPLAAHAQGRLEWSGTVDDRATVSLHGRDIQTRTVSGRSVSTASSQVFGRLPNRPVFVSLRKRGRGTVRVVQQPRPSNGYTAVVRIYDPQPGDARYRFTLLW